MILVDKCRRPLLNMRVAVTRRCNLRCDYCHMEGEEMCGGRIGREMSVDEIVHIVRVAIGLGISNVKLTGGEPLVREDIREIVYGIAALEGLDDLSMTTNGLLLDPLALELHSAGLKRLNITIPTLDKQVYNKITGGHLDEALKGVEAAVKAGFCPLKINMLILKDVNDNCVSEMIDFSRKTGATLQLIELEKVNITDAFYVARHKPLNEYETMLKQNAIKVETRKYMQNRRVYDLPNVKVEVIRPNENAEFCMHCTRLRLTSDGKLKLCLMISNNLVDILTPLRSGASDLELSGLFESVNERRQPYSKH